MRRDFTDCRIIFPLARSDLYRLVCSYVRMSNIASRSSCFIQIYMKETTYCEYNNALSFGDKNIFSFFIISMTTRFPHILIYSLGPDTCDGHTCSMSSHRHVFWTCYISPCFTSFKSITLSFRTWRILTLIISIPQVISFSSDSFQCGPCCRARILLSGWRISGG